MGVSLDSWEGSGPCGVDPVRVGSAGVFLRALRFRRRTDDHDGWSDDDLHALSLDDGWSDLDDAALLHDDELSTDHVRPVYYVNDASADYAGTLRPSQGESR